MQYYIYIYDCIILYIPIRIISFVAGACSWDEFVCPNGVCLPHIYTCDGANDCGDWADENTQYCEHGKYFDIQDIKNTNRNCQKLIESKAPYTFMYI